MIVACLAGFLVGGFAVYAVIKSVFSAREKMLDETVTGLRESLDEERAELNNVRSELTEEREKRARAETRLEETIAAKEEQQRLLDEATKKLSDTFGALSSDALKSNNQAFLDLARKTFENILTESKGDLSKRQQAIEAIVKPVTESLERYQTGLKEMEKARSEAYGSLRRHLTDLAEQQKELQRETHNLASGLKSPQIRGRWGEITLRRVVEMAGMSEHCDFIEQPSAGSVEGRLRPDMTVTMPGGRTVVIDSKTPLSAYLDAMSPDLDEAGKRRKMEQHAQAVRSHLLQLGGKQYWSQFKSSPDFVVLFLPAESIFSAALQIDNSLIEEGVRKKVILATPTTLIALLRAVAYGWQEARMAENARKIADVGTELFERVRSFVIHMDKLRDGLGKATAAYNSAVGSMERRILPSARRLTELGASAHGRELPEIRKLEQDLRDVQQQNDPPSE